MNVKDILQLATVMKWSEKFVKPSKLIAIQLRLSERVNLIDVLSISLAVCNIMHSIDVNISCGLVQNIVTLF